MKIDQRETAVAAYHERVKPAFALSMATQIFNLLTHVPDASIGELAAETGWQKSSVSARVKELREAGRIEAAPERKDMISGITITPWRVVRPGSQGRLF